MQHRTEMLPILEIPWLDRISPLFSQKVIIMQKAESGRCDQALTELVCNNNSILGRDVMMM